MNRSYTTLVVGIVVVFCFTIAAVVALAIAVPDGENTGTLVTVLLAQLGTTIASLVTLTKVQQTGNQVNELTNGLMDAKVRAGVADVVKPNLVNPAAHAQLAEDRAAAHPEGT